MPRLFGTDGVRGAVGEWPLVPEFALALGRAAGSVLAAHSKQPLVLVGRDTRQSGPMLQSALVAGLLASGAHVLELDVITTPGISWLTHKLGARAGVVISASHNPVRQNGIKFFGPEGLKLPEALEEEIERIADPQPEDTIPNTIPPRIKPGRIMDGRGMRELYIEGLLAEHHDLQLDRLTVVLDCANGAASEYAPEVFARAGVNVVAIHASPTGLNINLDAGSENVRQWPGKMKALIQSHHANFGVAFDGDADRAIFVDQNGGVVDGDHMLGILARYLDGNSRLLARSVVTTTMRNAGLKKFVEMAGLTMYETPVGDKYVTEKLLELRHNAPPAGVLGLGGEQSGHVILLDDAHVTGDGMRTALFVMRAFLESGADSMTEFAAGIGKTPQVIASADVGRGPRLDKFALVEVENQTLADNPGLTRINLRYSGTEPKFRAMLDSDGRLSEEALADIALKICRQIQAASGMDHAQADIEIQDCSRGGLLKGSTD